MDGSNTMTKRTLCSLSLRCNVIIPGASERHVKLELLEMSHWKHKMYYPIPINELVSFKFITLGVRLYFIVSFLYR